MRMRSYRKAAMYQLAFKDAHQIWELMTPNERRSNFDFSQSTMKELYLLAKAQRGE